MLILVQTLPKQDLVHRHTEEDGLIKGSYSGGLWELQAIPTLRYKVA